MNAVHTSGPFAFELPDALNAQEPPEARGLARDQVRLLVSDADGIIAHRRFHDLPDFLSAGDVVVVNSSATINAALPARRGGERVRLHLSAQLPDGRWIVELRRGSSPLLDARAGELIDLPGGGTATLLEPFRVLDQEQVRLWIADLVVPGDALAYTERFGSPIRYGYLRHGWPLEYYQTIFAKEPGSAEMPSAGRAFTHELVTRLRRRGVRIATIVLHTGVGSLDSGETPYPERYRVPAATALAINAARADGYRVIATGTTVVRALETVTDANRRAHADAGWTDLHITADRGVRAIDGLITGLHAPRASHLELLEAVAGREHLERAYHAALEHRYLWHEFGDMHFLMR